MLQEQDTRLSLLISSTLPGKSVGSSNVSTISLSIWAPTLNTKEPNNLRKWYKNKAVFTKNIKLINNSF